MSSKNELVSIALEYERSYEKLGIAMKSFDCAHEFSLPENFEVTLGKLIYRRTFQLLAFEILLRHYPESAIQILKERYLAVDLLTVSKDQTADFIVMLADVKDILGTEKLEEIIASKDFLPSNKKLKRVKEAIASLRSTDQ